MTERPAINETISSLQADYDSLRYVSSETVCPYLPGLQARSETYFVDRLDGATYERLLSRGFRRCGRTIYRPRCRACNECRQLRVPVAEFTPTRSMRRIARRNADVHVEVGDPNPTHGKFLLFTRYLNAQHDATMPRNYESFVEFLYDSPLRTDEIHYYLGRHLIGVSIADRVPGGLSTVYMYFDPRDAARSPGTFSVLWELDYCRRQGLRYYYLGYYVAGSQTMAYKSRFRPHELLIGDERWLSIRA